MTPSTEMRMFDIENSLRELKGSCPTAGSLVQMYVTTATFTTTIKADYPLLRFKFTPTLEVSGDQMVTLSGSIDQASLFLKYFGGQGVPEPQDGSGESVIGFQLVSQYVGYEAPEAEVTVRIVASSTSPGTFTMLA